MAIRKPLFSDNSYCFDIPTEINIISNISDSKVNIGNFGINLTTQANAIILSAFRKSSFLDSIFTRKFSMYALTHNPIAAINLAKRKKNKIKISKYGFFI